MRTNEVSDTTVYKLLLILSIFILVTTNSPEMVVLSLVTSIATSIYMCVNMVGGHKNIIILVLDILIVTQVHMDFGIEIANYIKLLVITKNQAHLIIQIASRIIILYRDRLSELDRVAEGLFSKKLLKTRAVNRGNILNELNDAAAIALFTLMLFILIDTVFRTFGLGI